MSRLAVGLSRAQANSRALHDFLHEDGVCPKCQPSGIFPAILNALAAEHHGHQVLVNQCVFVVNGEAGTCG